MTTRDDVLSTVKDAATEVLGVDADAVVEDATFKDDLGADSLDLVELVMALEERMDISIPEEELEGIKTVGQAVDVVLGKLAARA
ncbi:MAG TPA: acyl carrier protein [Acidimicrobiales bacterium]|nr:acyl carrier protein [Acidimicrobiales bacterium]